MKKRSLRRAVIFGASVAGFDSYTAGPADGWFAWATFAHGAEAEVDGQAHEGQDSTKRGGLSQFKNRR